MNIWDWFTTTAPAGAIINALGLGALAALFASDRIITRGQHARRVADIEAAHRAVMVERDARYQELKESRNYYREARIVERDRADKVTDQLAEALELARLNTQLLQSLNEATREATI